MADSRLPCCFCSWVYRNLVEAHVCVLYGHMSPQSQKGIKLYVLVYYVHGKIDQANTLLVLTKQYRV